MVSILVYDRDDENPATEHAAAAAVTLTADAAANRTALVAQLYDEWGGCYVLQRIDGGVYVDVRPLDRDEALTYRTQSGEVLRLVWEPRT